MMRTGTGFVLAFAIIALMSAGNVMADELEVASAYSGHTNLDLWALSPQQIIALGCTHTLTYVEKTQIWSWDSDWYVDNDEEDKTKDYIMYVFDAEFEPEVKNIFRWLCKVDGGGTIVLKYWSSGSSSWVLLGNNGGGSPTTPVAFNVTSCWGAEWLILLCVAPSGGPGEDAIRCDIGDVYY